MAIATIHTYADIASSLDLWRERVDPDMGVSEAEFKAMPLEKRIALIAETYGPEPTEAEVNDDLGFDA